MTTLPTSLFYVPVYPTHGDDALAEKGTEDPNAGQGISGGGNGIGTSVSGSYLFNSSTEIGDTSVEGLSVRNLTSLGTWMGAPAGIKWGSGPVGTGATLTYSFYVAGVSQYQEAEGQSPAFSFTPQQQSAAQMGMQSFANVANITFTQVTDTANSAGDIRWGNSTVPGTALAYFPGNSGSSGNVWFGTQYSDYAFPALGNYGYHTFIHELGHALGLAHPHSSTTNLPVPGHDRLQYSIMSYRGYTGQPLGSGYNLDYFPTTPMIDDIAALQAMYGANMSYNATNTVYSWAPGAKIFETIWDAGGIDLIDASNQTQGAIINLQPGTLSSVGASIWNGSTNMRDTLGIAYGAIIENATGSGFADIISGNSVANHLIGGGGNDTLRGFDGNDTLVGGTGNDSLEGGTGDDTYEVDAASDLIVEASNAGTDEVRINLGTGTYTLGNNVENAVLLPGAAAGLTGNALANHLAGNALSNTLNGGAGIDTLEGAAGDDTYEVDVAGDVIVEALGEGTDLVRVNLASGTYTLDDHVENATVISIAAVGITGNGLDNLLTGNAAANTLTGDAGNDTLNGAAGGDRLVGGLGDDKYLVDMASDVIVEAIGEGTDSVEVTFTAAGTYALSASVENATITNALNVNLTGSVDANVLTGGAGANLLSGAGGNDTLIGGLGKDTLDGGADTDTVVLEGNFAEYAITRPNATDVQLVRGGNTTIVRNVENFQFGDGTRTLADIQGSTGGPLNDSLVGNADANTLDGGAGNDTVSGLAGNDTLLGGLGDDSLAGGEGDDNLVGGAGNDTYEVDTENDLVVEALNGGTDTVRIALGAGTYTLAANVENATIISLAAVGITGNALNNVLTGNGEANALSGAVGNDTLNGGAGNDTLDGGAGTDRLVGGLGDDTYVVDVATDVVSENAGEGTDEVQLNLAVAGTYTLGLNVENGVITTANTALKINLTGNGGNNVLTGNGGDNLLSGGAGDDTLVGGLGNDTLDGGTGVADRAVFSGNYADYTVARISATDTRLTHIGTGQITIVRNVDVFEFSGGTTMTAAEVVANTAGIGNDTLSGTAQADLIDGLAGNDSLSGLAGNDTLNGGLGDDTLVGGEGDDSLEGGAGNDTYEVDSNADLVVEALSAGTDLVRVALTSGSYTLGVNVENATITSSAAVGLNGNALGNVLTGNDEANALSGAVGNDTLNGGAGNDTLDGGAGTDRLVGGLGDDTYMVDAGTDVIAELAGQGTDTVQVGFTLAGTYTLALNVENALVTNALNVNLTGNPDGNVLTGGAGANLLNGAGGNDTLMGGLGKDTLTGGTGSDRFEFSTAPSVGNVDTITDFVSGVDVIALSADIFTGLGVAGNTVGLSANLTYNSTTGVLAYDADGAGAGAPMQIALLGASTHPAALGSDFLLI